MRDCRNVVKVCSLKRSKSFESVNARTGIAIVVIVFVADRTNGSTIWIHKRLHRRGSAGRVVGDKRVASQVERIERSLKLQKISRIRGIGKEWRLLHWATFTRRQAVTIVATRVRRWIVLVEKKAPEYDESEGSKDDKHETG